ncbi:hypothetical protein J3R30DRAFT_3703406 [Lentinula aciculospora]|uniref:CCDC174 alpha/beta GRSR domain-containing protein n=1 Tax=Lentinula aciculospora TaxID=153920 RepID=A0A9W9A8T5_9AGAR|nr:hypothetical protein J3R30DRAFT_3703406 [Lentinula aciculospora]
MHSATSKAKGISGSSLFDLKAEISKQEEEFARDKAAGKKYIPGRAVRPDKKPTKWSLPNKGVQARAARDVETLSRPTLENIRISLESQSKRYSQLMRGKTGGLSEKDLDALLVDFDAKGVDSKWESDNDDVDESLTVPAPPTNDEDDPLVEYLDEFGRNRMSRRSEVPRYAKLDEEVQEDDDAGVIRNPQILQGHFPTYQPGQDRITQITNEYSEENNPLEKHYDPNSEVRVRGAASYNFAKDEQTRQARLDELKSRHLETSATRKEMGASDIRPGEIEGMQASEVGSSTKGSEKRKREIEERRRTLDAKRKKAKIIIEGSQSDPNLATSSVVATNLRQTLVSSQPIDPFAALESASSSTGFSNKGKGKAHSQSDADKFLAQLGNEMLNKRRK